MFVVVSLCLGMFCVPVDYLNIRCEDHTYEKPYRVKCEWRTPPDLDRLEACQNWSCSK